MAAARRSFLAKIGSCSLRVCLSQLGRCSPLLFTAIHFQGPSLLSFAVCLLHVCQSSTSHNRLLLLSCPYTHSTRRYIPFASHKGCIPGLRELFHRRHSSPNALRFNYTNRRGLWASLIEPTANLHRACQRRLRHIDTTNSHRESPYHLPVTVHPHPPAHTHSLPAWATLAIRQTRDFINHHHHITSINTQP
jgi:hypothetical protein